MTEVVQGKAYKISLKLGKVKERRDVNHLFFFITTV